MEEILKLLRREITGAWRFRWWAMGVAWAVCVLGWFAIYSMPDIYEARNYNDPCTDYLVWSANAADRDRPGHQDAAVEDLPGLMLKATQREKEFCP